MLYHYKCKNCGNEFDELLKVEERNKPCDESCKCCGCEKSVEIVIGNVLSIWKTQRSTL